MDYKKINDFFKDLTSFKNNYNLVHQEQVVERSGYEKSYDERYEIYDAKLEDGYFVKISYQTDSYGSNEQMIGIAFVKGKEKKVIVYEF